MEKNISRGLKKIYFKGSDGKKKIFQGVRNKFPENFKGSENISDSVWEIIVLGVKL